MAVLSNADRFAVWAEYMVNRSIAKDSLPLSKADLRAAVDAIDVWVDSNAASFNSAIPLPARTALTSKQKALLLVFVVDRRFEVI